MIKKKVCHISEIHACHLYSNSFQIFYKRNKFLNRIKEYTSDMYISYYWFLYFLTRLCAINVVNNTCKIQSNSQRNMKLVIFQYFHAIRIAKYAARSNRCNIKIVILEVLTCYRGSGKFRYSVRNKKTKTTKKGKKMRTTVDTIFSRIFGVDNIIKFFLFFFSVAYDILKYYIPRLISVATFCWIG